MKVQYIVVPLPRMGFTVLIYFHLIVFMILKVQGWVACTDYIDKNRRRGWEENRGAAKGEARVTYCRYPREMRTFFSGTHKHAHSNAHSHSYSHNCTDAKLLNSRVMRVNWLMEWREGEKT